MKKKLIFTGFCLLALLMLPTLAEAQPASCASNNFTINTTTTPSTCQSNGTITVTIGGSTGGISSPEYSLIPTGSNTFSLPYQSSNVLTGVPAGTYTVSVRAFCTADGVTYVIGSKTGVVVDGNYVVPQASLNITQTRKSYQAYPTGRIVLNVTGGNGNFTFTVTKAPTGVTTPVTVSATKSGYPATVFTLAGENWPAGDYTVQADDGCFTASTTFTLEGGVTGLPKVGTESPLMFNCDVDNTQGSCNYVKLSWILSTPTSSSAGVDHYQYFTTGMYEIGIAPAGTNINAVTNWQTWSTSNLFFNIAPYNVSNFYAANSLAVYLRLKNCQSINKSFTTNIQKPGYPFTFISERNCNNYNYWVNGVTNDYSAVLCYPLHVTIKKNSDGTVVYDNPNWLSRNVREKIVLDYGVAYTGTVTDQNGTTTGFAISPLPSIGFQWGNDFPNLYCSGYTLGLYAYFAKPDSCLVPGTSTTITIKDPGGAVVQQIELPKIVPSTQEFPDSTQEVISTILDYDKIYSFISNYPDGTSDSVTYTMPTPVVTYSFDAISDNCTPNTGNLMFYRSTSPHYSSQPNQQYPVGTTFTVTGPPGYTTQTVTATTGRDDYMYMDPAFLPAGTYTFKVENECGGKTYQGTLNYKGGYDYTNFGYTSQPAVPACSGIRIYPTGQITLGGTATDTYFYLKAGPQGYDQTIIKQGGSFLLSTPGVYLLAISNNNYINPFCTIALDTIVYALPQLSLDANITASYVCVGGTDGNISIIAKDGTAPYTYQLWDSLNTTKQPPADITTSGVAYFSYGQGGKTYTVRVSDACGNNFAQQTKVLDLNTARIIYATTDRVCVGDTIKMNCVTLGTTAYSWTGPNGYTSNMQHPVIPNAQANRTGWYKVSVKPEYCGTYVTDSIYITVANLSNGLPLGAENQTICVRTAIPALTDSIAGGSGIYTYQWQSSPDGTTGWTNIAGATGSVYQPVVQTQTPGIYYYRRITTDNCTTLNGNAITLTVKSCYVPVNPHLMNKAKGTR